MDVDPLRSVSCLRALDATELTHLAGLLTARDFQPRERIVEEGKEVGAFYIVQRGTVHVRRRAENREVLLGRIDVGGFFGEINLFDPGMATASVYAVDAVTIAMIDYGTLRAFMEAHSVTGYKIVAALMGEVCARLRLTNDRFVNSVFWSSQAQA